MNDIESGCSITFSRGRADDGTEVFVGTCTACGLLIRAATREDAQARFDYHVSIPAPPPEVLRRPITPADVDNYPEYFLNGSGYGIAARLTCEHGRALTDPCDEC
ncbi:hypothetical protein [Nocardia sp. NPDC059239]|uniref:hypothetical protein n=1 Tax=unclassified Nocardia TaxID=2637762 RepID=UPI0036B42740